MAGLAELRKEYPDLGGLSDNDAVDVIHDIFYADLPREQVANALGVKPTPASTAAAPRGIGGVVKDAAKSFEQGVLELPGQVAGLADVVPALVAGKRPFTDLANTVGDVTGFRPGTWAKEIELSPQAQDEQKAIESAWADKNSTAADIAAAYVRNPAYVLNLVAQSLPSMIAGGVGGRALMAAGRVAPVAEGAEALPGFLERATGKWAPAIAGGVGEGSQQVGQQMVQGEGNPDQRRNAIAALASGGIDAVIGAGTGRLANATGLETLETAIAGGKRTGKVLGPTARIVGGGTEEALFQELPQSAQEQVWQNYAEGKPLWDGVPRQAVEGALAGLAAGGLANVRGGARDHLPDTGPMSRAANAAAPQVAPVAAAAGIDPSIQEVAQTGPTIVAGGPSAAPAAAPAEPMQDPVLARINSLEGNDRSEALAAYSILNREDAPKGVRQYNSRLLDDLLAKLDQPKLESSDPAALLSQGMNRDPLQGALQQKRDEQTAQANLDQWMARAPAMPLQQVQEMKAEADAQGMALTIVPHGAGQGFTLVPEAWITPAMRGQVGAAIPMDTTPTGVLRADASGIVAPETQAQAIGARQVAGQQLAERQRRADLGLTPDIEAAQARIPRQPAGPDITAASGGPFRTRGAAVRAQRKVGRGRVVEVEGGWVVRGATDAPAAAENTVDTTARELPALAHDTSPTGVLRADPQGRVAPETNADRINTRQVLAVQRAERERKLALGLTPDVEAVQAGVKRRPKPDAQPGDVLNKQGKPFANRGAAVRAQRAAGGGELVEVRGGWVVRAAAAASNGHQNEGADHGSAPVFLRTKSGPQSEGGNRAPALQKFVDAVTSQWANAPEVIVARDMQDERIPQEVRDADAAQRSQGADEKVNGFHHRGKVYLVADAIGSPSEALETLAHEAIGHHGLRGAFGDSLTPILRQIVAMRKKEVLEKAQAYGMPLRADAVRAELGPGATAADVQKVVEMRSLYAAEEVLAEMAATNPQLGFVKRAIAAIRTWLREHVPGFKDMALTDDEVARSFLLPARGWVVRGRAAEGGFPGATPAAQFSRGSIAGRLEDAVREVTVPDLKRRAGNTLADYRGLGLSLLGRRQIVEIYGKDLPQLERFNKLAQQMDAEKNEAGAEADQVATDWGKVKDHRQLAELMHDATLQQIDPAKEFVQGDNRHEYGRLRQRFEHLTPEAKDVYRRARDMFEEHYAQVREAVRARIGRSELTEERKAAMLARMDGEFFEKIKGVYFPLARFGQYVIVVKDGAGKTANVSRAETLNEAEATRKRLLAAYPAQQGFVVGKVLKSAEFSAAKDGVGRGFLKDLFALLDKEGVGDQLQDAINQLYLGSLPDLSWAKHGIHRKGMPGYSQDARRAFAHNIFHGARYLAKLRHADQLQAQLEAMQRHVDAHAADQGYDSVAAQHVVDEMTKRYETLMSSKANALSSALTSFGFVFHLGLSPASALVNLTQTPLVAYPILGAKWGFDKAAGALLSASKLAAANRNDLSRVLTGDEKQAYDEAVRAGVIDVTLAHDLAGVAQGEDSKLSWKMRPVMKAASFLFHHAEKFNRQTTFVAAYRLAREAGAAHEAAYDQAVEATYAGHFDYAASNRPRAMQGNVARVVLLFKQFAQNMIYTLSRQAYLAVKGLSPRERAQARRALSGLLVMHAMGAGVLGLPLVSTLLSVASFIGGDDDEPWDAETALRNVLADAFGQKPAEVLARGLSRLTPWDVSGRIGLDRLIFPDVQEGLQGQRLAESFMTGALGPLGSIGVSALKGAQDIADGEWLRGLETMMPAALRGPLKALRYASEGAVDKSGVVIKEDVGPAGIAGQALGFSPSEVRLASEARGAIYQQDQRLQRRRQTLMRQYAMATMAGDQEGQQDARDMIARFNAVNPARRILPVHLRQSIRNRRKRIEEAEDGVFLPRSRRDALEAGRFGTSN